MGVKRHSVSVPRTFAVLCVDDHGPGLKIRKTFLESFGYVVQIASSGPEALELAATNDFDAVVLDYRMPGMSGLELARALRQYSPSLPLIVLSGYTSQLPEGLQELVNGFVAKGSHPESLLAQLEKVLGDRPRQRRAPVETSTPELLEEAKRHVEEGKRQVQRAREATSRGRTPKPGRRSA